MIDLDMVDVKRLQSRQARERLEAGGGRLVGAEAQLLQALDLADRAQRFVRNRFPRHLQIAEFVEFDQFLDPRIHRFTKVADEEK